MNQKLKRVIFDYIGITIGSILIALALTLFLIPNRIAAGGVSGFATVIYYLFQFPVGVVMILINVPLFIIGVKVLGRNMGFRTLYGILILSLATEIFPIFLSSLTNDPILASLYGGVLVGLGVGFVFKSKGTTGGTDLVAAILHHFFPAVSMGQGLLVVDAVVIVLAGVVFNAELALYAVLSIFISSKVIDLVQEGFNLTKAVLIISRESDMIRKEVLHMMDRGVTTLAGRGGYTGEDKDVLMVIVTRSEVTTLKRLVYKIDPRSFVILTDVHEVMGEGFQELVV